MKKLNKNNKGFSLVEIIVVILIMAILTVALAPQVLKWVNNARIATDVQVKDSFVTACQTALTNETAYREATGATDDIVIKINSTGVSFENTPSNSVFEDKVFEYAGISATTDVKTKTDGQLITIKISKSNASVSATMAVENLDN